MKARKKGISAKHDTGHNASNDRSHQTAMMAVRKAKTQATITRPTPGMPKTGAPVLKQVIFGWKFPNKYIEVCNFAIEVKTIFLTKSYNIQGSQRVPIIMTRLGHEGPRLL